jgi:hypothetical protein
VKRERERVEDVPEVDDERGERDGGQGCGRGDHADQQQFQGARECGHRQGRGKPPRKAGLDEQQTECDPERKDSEPRRERVAHSCADLLSKVLLHGSMVS